MKFKDIWWKWWKDAAGKYRVHGRTSNGEIIYGQTQGYGRRSRSFVNAKLFHAPVRLLKKQKPGIEVRVQHTLDMQGRLFS